MPSQFITTNIRLPKLLYKNLKRRAVEEEKSFAEIIRNALVGHEREYIQDKSIPQKRTKTIADLAEMAEPMGKNLSSNIDNIVYGASNR